MSHAAKFVSGSTMRHVLVMTSTSAFGLVAIFFVDLIDLYFISQLGEKEKAALGYALPLNFIMISMGIGLMVAAIVLISRAIGAGDRQLASRYAINIVLFAFCMTSVAGLVLWVSAPYALKWMGAKGEAFDLALSFLRIVIFSAPLIGTSICMSGILRAAGDARLPMIANLTGALANLCLDPLLIFYFELGMDGAALATLLARVCVISISFIGVFFIHKLLRKPEGKTLFKDIPTICFFAIPALFTSLANPVGDGIVTSAMSEYGDEAVAGWGIISRIIPVAFGTLFALSGAVGPIIGQNLGAKLFDRVFGTMRNAVFFIGIYVLVIWIVLSLSHNLLSDLFNASDLSRELIRGFCLWFSPLFAFLGILLISNAMFNILGRPIYSTGFTWGRATLGAIPLIYLGGQWFGAIGIVGAYMFSTLIFGSIAFILCNYLVNHVSRR